VVGPHNMTTQWPFRHRISTGFHNQAGMGEAGAAAFYKDSAAVHPMGRIG